MTLADTGLGKSSFELHACCVSQPSFLILLKQSRRSVTPAGLVAHSSSTRRCKFHSSLLLLFSVASKSTYWIHYNSQEIIVRTNCANTCIEQSLDTQRPTHTPKCPPTPPHTPHITGLNSHPILAEHEQEELFATQLSIALQEIDEYHYYTPTNTPVGLVTPKYVVFTPAIVLQRH